METSLNNLGKAFWDGGIFGVAKVLQQRGGSQAHGGKSSPPAIKANAPTLTINDHGISGFEVEPKWLDYFREVQSVTMARPFPSLRELEGDLLAMRVLMGGETDEFKKIVDCIVKDYGVKSPMEIRVKLALTPEEASGPNNTFDISDEEARLLQTVTAFVLGHEVAGNFPFSDEQTALFWETNEERIRDLCRLAASIPRRGGKMTLDIDNFGGLLEVCTLFNQFIKELAPGPLADFHPGDETFNANVPSEYLGYFTAWDDEELTIMFKMFERMTTAGEKLEPQIFKRLNDQHLGAYSKPSFARRPKIFVFDGNSPIEGLEPWYQYIRKVKDFVYENENPTLFELSSAILNKCGLAYEVRGKWVDKAHEIREYMGVANLCEVPIRIEL